MKHRFAALLLLALAATVTSPAMADDGQATSATAVENASMRSPRSQLVLEGRLSVRYEQEGKNQQLTGQFLWQQDAAQTRILLSSPTGQALAEILVTANQASLTQAGQATRSAGNVDQLTSEILGWPLPVAGLRDWLQGFALNAKGARFIASPEQDSVATLDGWHIRYASWHDNTHPKRIDLERHIDAQGADVSLRMLIDSAT